MNSASLIAWGEQSASIQCRRDFGHGLLKRMSCQLARLIPDDVALGAEYPGGGFKLQVRDGRQPTRPHERDLILMGNSREQRHLDRGGRDYNQDAALTAEGSGQLPRRGNLIAAVLQ